MSRLVHRPIEVTTRDDEPVSFTDQGQTYVITHIFDSWLEAGAWWEGEGHRACYRVQTSDMSLFDIERNDKGWSLYRVWD